MDFLVAIFPLALLIWLMTKRNSLSSSLALPLAAFVLFGFKWIYFKDDLIILHAATIHGLLTALTPISIVWGAILLFKTMEISGSLVTVREWLNHITSNKIGQLMIVGWSFSFLVEGISGFGTPAALAAPLLVGLGFPVLPTAIFCLILNTAPVPFGAVGMPTWFGFGQLGLTNDELLEVGFKTALIQSVASLIIPLFALRMIVTWREIYNNIVFIYFSIIGSMLPYLLLARFSVEFPSVIGGFMGLALSLFLARHHIGLDRREGSLLSNRKSFSIRTIIKALFPIVGTILILLVSRLPHLGVKSWLTKNSPFWNIDLGVLGDLQISSSLVVRLEHILGTQVNWQHAILYVPSLLPFALVSVICFFIFRMPRDLIRKTLHETWGQLRNPLIALLGAMVFVKLFMVGGERSLAHIIGQSLGSISGGGWQFGAVYLGAFGSFFSGSNTVSNLTFGAIQDSIATTAALNRTMILSLQSVGGAMGGMICIHNIVAVCAILGLRNQEGLIIKKTFWLMILYGLIAGFVSLVI